jgi:hypothetical protein
MTAASKTALSRPLAMEARYLVKAPPVDQDSEHIEADVQKIGKVAEESAYTEYQLTAGAKEISTRLEACHHKHSATQEEITSIRTRLDQVVADKSNREARRRVNSTDAAEEPHHPPAIQPASHRWAVSPPPRTIQAR